MRPSFSTRLSPCLARSVSLAGLCLWLSACANGGEWPHLSDPLPDNADRDRQITPIPVPPPMIAESLDGPADGAAVRLEEATLVFRDSMARFDAAVRAFEATNDAREQAVNWRSAQFHLSRVGDSLTPLLRALNSGVFGATGSPSHSEARDFLKSAQARIKKAAERLAAINPQTQ